MPAIWKQKVIVYLWAALIFVSIFVSVILICERIPFLRHINEAFPIAFVIAAVLALLIFFGPLSRAVDKQAKLEIQQIIDEIESRKLKKDEPDEL